LENGCTVEILVVGVIGVLEVQPFGKRNKEIQRSAGERNIRTMVVLFGASAWRGRERDGWVRWPWGGDEESQVELELEVSTSRLDLLCFLI
jgi:hypothetical protein